MPFPPAFLQKYGPWAVVTGASSGIGLEFATQLAASGMSVVLVARRGDRLEKLSAALREQYPIQTKLITADLSTAAGRDAVIAGSADLDVGLLVNNAGVESVGAFFRDPPEAHAKLLEVNVMAVTLLAHAIGPRIAARAQGGGILFVSSMSANLMPWFAIYSASKAYVRSLALLLKEELRERRVDVMSLEPGMVDSEMSGRVNGKLDSVKMGFKSMTAEQCVTEALEQLWGGTATYTPGLMNRVMMTVMGLLPQWVQLKAMKSQITTFIEPELMTWS